MSSDAWPAGANLRINRNASQQFIALCHGEASDRLNLSQPRPLFPSPTGFTSGLFQPAGHDHSIFDRVAELFVKADYLLVGLANHQHHFRYASVGEPFLRVIHYFASGTGSL